jgi:hypothetical protein
VTGYPITTNFVSGQTASVAIQASALLYQPSPERAPWGNAFGLTSLKLQPSWAIAGESVCECVFPSSPRTLPCPLFRTCVQTTRGTLRTSASHAVGFTPFFLDLVATKTGSAASITRVPRGESSTLIRSNAARQDERVESVRPVRRARLHDASNRRTKIITHARVDRFTDRNVFGEWFFTPSTMAGGQTKVSPAAERDYRNRRHGEQGRCNPRRSYRLGRIEKSSVNSGNFHRRLAITGIEGRVNPESSNAVII